MTVSGAVTLVVPDALNGHAMAEHAVADALQLLSRSFPDADVTRNHPRAKILIMLPEPKPATATGRADRSYTWRSSRQGKQVVLQLAAATPEAISSSGSRPLPCRIVISRIKSLCA